jgi:hypothetical protein
MDKCKQCNNEIQTQLAGVKRFCSHECKKEHRKRYMTTLMANKRQNKPVSSKDGYLILTPDLLAVQSLVYQRFTRAKISVRDYLTCMKVSAALNGIRSLKTIAVILM